MVTNEKAAAENPVWGPEADVQLLHVCYPGYMGLSSHRPLGAVQAQLSPPRQQIT